MKTARPLRPIEHEAANHTCLRWKVAHPVLGRPWASTSDVAPPDGAMADYMASLDKVIARPDRLFLPGDGGAVAEPQRLMRGLKAQRKMRERAILERLAAGD